jgi:hypothetical protein
MAALYGYHTCAEGDESSGVGMAGQLQMQEIALSRLKELGVAVAALAERLINLADVQGNESFSPFVADSLYAIAKNYLWYISETGNTDAMRLVEVLFTALRRLGARWAVASKLTTPH